MAIFHYPDDLRVQSAALAESDAMADGIAAAEELLHEGLVYDHNFRRRGGVGLANLAPRDQRNPSFAEEFRSHGVEFRIEPAGIGGHSFRPKVRAPVAIAEELHHGSDRAAHAWDRRQFGLRAFKNRAALYRGV